MAESAELKRTCERVTALLIDHITGDLDPTIVPVFEWTLPFSSDSSFGG